MKKVIILAAIMSGIIVATGCQSSKENANNNTQPQETALERPIDNSAMMMPPVIVYKTSADYSNLVPVNMDDSKTTIVSYPDPVDVKAHKRPTLLENGYLLDNFGIGRNVAYMDYTYEEYAALDKVPEMETLLQHIIDRNPLTEYYVSNEEYPRGSKGRNIEILNQSIASGMKGFNKIEL